jgi:glycosyltransferase involved in cell wall biosynthesis
MRILYSHRVQSRDGQGVHIEELVRAFRDAGHEVLIVAPGFYDQASFGGESRVVAAIRRLLPGAAAELAELAYNLQAIRRAERAWQSFRPDLIYERCNLYFTVGATLARRHGTPFFLEVNSPLAQERAQHGGLRLGRLARRMEHATWRAATRVLPVTAALADIVAASGVPRDRITVMPNGVDPARFPSRPEPAPDAPVRLGFVGFMRPWHGLDTVLAALARNLRRDVTLTLVGDGPACPGLRAQAKALGLADRVVFTGVVPPEQVASLVAGFDVALQPQATPYASPLKIFDYLAAGCAIVAPRQPNILEILTDGQNALLFDAAEPDGLGRAVETLLESPALRRQLGAAARQTIMERDYTWAGNAARITRLAETASP